MVTKTIKKAFLITALLSIPYVAVKAADAGSPDASGIPMPELNPAQKALVQAFIETKAQLEQNQTELDQTKQELDQTRQELVAAQAKNKQLTSDYAALELHIEATDEAVRQAEGLKARVVELQQSNKSLRSQYAELQAQLKDQVRQLEGQIEQKELVVTKQAAALDRALGENASLDKEVKDVVRENSSLKNALDKQGFALKKLTQELSNATTTVILQQEKAAQLQDQVVQLHSQIAAGAKEIDALTAQLELVKSALTSEQQTHQATLENANRGENLADLMQHFAQTEDTQKVAELNGAIVCLQSEKALLVSQLESLKGTIKGLEKDLEASNKESAKNKELANGLYKEIERRLQNQNAIDSRIQELDNTAKEKFVENEKLKIAAEYNKRQLESLHKQKANVEQELSQVHRQLKEAQATLATTSASLTTISTEVATLKASHAATDAKNAELKTMNKALEDLRKALEERVKKQDEQFERQNALLVNAQKQVAAAQARVADLLGAQSNSNQAKELARLQAQVADLERIQAELQNNNVQLKETVDRQAAQVAGLRAEKATLAKQVGDQSSRIAQLDSEIVTLSKQIETLKIEITELQETAMAQAIADGDRIAALRQQIATMPAQQPVGACESLFVIAGANLMGSSGNDRVVISTADLRRFREAVEQRIKEYDKQVADLIANIEHRRDNMLADIKTLEQRAKDGDKAAQTELARLQAEKAALKQAEITITKDVAAKVKDLAQQLMSITNEKTALDQELITKGYAQGHQGAFTAWMRQGKSKPKRQVEIEARLNEIAGFITNLETQITQAIDAGILEAKKLAASQPGRR